MTVSNSLEQVIEQYGRLLPLLHKLESTPQDAEWHAEGNVAIHTQMVMDQVAQESLSDKPDRVRTLTLAAAFHDIAKPLTTREREINGRTRVVSPRHAQVGRSYLALHSSSIEIPYLNDVLALVGHHHDVRKLVMDDLGRGHYARLSRLCPMA